MFAGSWSRRHFIAAALAGSHAGWAEAAGKTILVLGDSLSAEYGLKRGTGWVALLEKKLSTDKVAATIVNASISGETTSGGRSRLPALLGKHTPGILVIELGANDALRGLPVNMTEDNLSQMTEAGQKVGAKVLLVGIQLPPNYGGDYSSRFAAIYERVAKKYKAAVVPFMLKGVADGSDPARMFQPDRIHPREEAHPVILENLWPELKKLLK